MQLLYIAFLFFIAALPVNAQDSLCPSGWNFATNTSYCYIVSTNYYTWDEAVNYCQSIGGSLAYIRSASEQSYLNGLTAGSFAQPWVGVRRNTTNGKFYNIDKIITSSYWLTGEPSVNGDCVTYRGATPSGMKVTPCYSIQPALCRQMPALCPSNTQYGGPNIRSGVISSPGYPTQYYNNLNCLYTITSPNNTYITIEFLPFAVEYYNDYVFVYDGNSTKSRFLGEVDYYSWDGDIDFESSNNSLTFIFKTNDRITNKGFQATWNAKANTPPIRQSGTNGSFTSQNYPNNYDPYAEQLYYLSTSYGFQINMTITDFITEAKYDVLEIYNASYVSSYTLVANLSGSSVAPYSFLSPSRYLTLRFKSNGSIQRKGFNAVWFMQ